MNLENKAIGEMGVEEADQEKDTLNVKHDKQELTAAVHMQSNDAGGGSEVGNNDEMLVVSRDDCMEENLMGSEDAKGLEAVTDAISVNEYTNTAKEELLLPNKNVCKGKNVVKKRKLVKKKVAIIKDEGKSKPSDMPDPSVEARTNEDAKIEENLAGKTMTDSVDKQNDVAGLACEVGDDEIFKVCKDDIIDGIFTGSENPKDLEARTDANTLNDDLNTLKEVSLLPEKKALRKKKVVKKRKLVKGKVGVAKDEEKLEESNLCDPSVEKNHPAEETMDDSPLDKEKIVASAGAQNDETGLTFEVGDDEDDIREERVMGSEDAKRFTDATSKIEKEKEQIRDDATKEMLLPEKKVVKRKKVIKKRIVVKGKAAMGKAGEKHQTSDMPKSNMKEAAKSQSKAKLTAEDNDGAEPSTKHNSSNKVETMGMIFMCSSKTKEDCYRYKIMGLPANKKDAVLKVYKGMRLFLFDFQLKLLYGIYKAAGPGGYNIEPNAFNSNFPSQVRFTAVRDCTPLPEEKFRSIIKDNYYSKNKFNCELNSEQVKSLCKLFQLRNKSNGKVVSERAKGQKKRRGRNENDERGGRERDNKRRRVAGNLRGSREKGNAVRPARDGDGSRRTRLEDDARRRARFEEDDARRRLRFELETEERRLRMEDRRHPPLGERYLRRADVVFEREAYLQPVLDALPPPALAPSYTALHSDYSRPTRLLYDYETSYLPSHREPPPPIVYRDPVYDVPTARSYYPSDDHLASTSRTSRYRLSPYRRY